MTFPVVDNLAIGTTTPSHIAPLGLVNNLDLMLSLPRHLQLIPTRNHPSHFSAFIYWLHMNSLVVVTQTSRPP